MNIRVLPCTFRAFLARSPRLSPSAPPAEAGRLAAEWKWIWARAAPESTRNTRPIRRQENNQPLHCQGWWRSRKICQVLMASSSGKM
ncbi:hypothetical protein D3C80_2020050 [compost metagenome]